MTRVLVSAASRHGSTTEIAEAIARGLHGHGIEADAVPPEQVEVTSDYDAFVIGSALYVGHWLEPAIELCERLGPDLAGRPAWLFSSGPVGPPESSFAKKMWTDPVDLERVRQATGAAEHRMFAGKLVRSELSRAQRAALFFFRRLDGDYRDWDEISAFANEVAGALGAPRADRIRTRR
ncbi:MAG TPA: flavodoxin domain-containing protein [Solirubrobacterales bacterium]|jgi:menaquinone-dependent protoporphyrinogen oxidase